MRLDTSASSGHRRTWRALLAVALAAVMCVAVAACGGDDSDSGNAGTAGTSGGSGGESLGDATVGILVPLTGELGDFGKSWEQAANLARDQINETGLPGGGKIETVIATTSFVYRIPHRGRNARIRHVSLG